jgi:RNA polymerase sigma-70 factor (ECF subfamily)
MGQVVALRRGQVLQERAVRETPDPLKSLAKEPNWTALLQQSANGDQLAVAELYDTTSSLVFGLALRILGERAAAEDVVVEVYAQVWTQAKTYDPQRGSPLSWLLTLTRSRAIDMLRARNRLLGGASLEAVGNVQDAAPDPEEASSITERRRVVRNALESLNEDQRRVIELAYFADLSHTEIAVRLGQPLGTVKTRIRMGLLRLCELLGPLAPATMGKEGVL